jgi:hypothetical protein
MRFIESALHEKGGVIGPALLINAITVASLQR